MPPSPSRPSRSHPLGLLSLREGGWLACSSGDIGPTGRSRSTHHFLRLLAPEAPTEIQLLLGGSRVSPSAPGLTWRHLPGRKGPTGDGTRRHLRKRGLHSLLHNRSPPPAPRAGPGQAGAPGLLRDGLPWVGTYAQVFTYTQVPLPCPPPWEFQDEASVLKNIKF